MKTKILSRNATLLIAIATATMFAASIVRAQSTEGNTLDVSSSQVVTTLDVSSPLVVTTTPGRAVIADFNGDLHPDWVLHNHATRQTAIWYMNNNVHVGGALGPTIAPGLVLECAEDFNDDNHTDYALFNPTNSQ